MESVSKSEQTRKVGYQYKLFVDLGTSHTEGKAFQRRFHFLAYQFEPFQYEGQLLL